MAAASERLIPPARAQHALRTLCLGSAICTGLLVVRFMWAGNLQFSGLFGNLLLAWIPLALAFLIRRMPHPAPRLWFWFTLIVWVLFFPNAYYLVTDLIHLKKFGGGGVARWYDMLMTASFAFAGIFLGSLSLYLMHLRVRERFGWRTGWGFAAGMLALGSFGIYLGRFLRLNSWDVVTRPLKLWGDVTGLLDMASVREAIGFSVAFFVFSLGVYSFMISFARLHEVAANREEG